VKPDLALDFQGLLRSALIARVSGARDIHCLGDAEPACRILAHRIVPAVRKAEHSVTRYLKLIADLGIDTSSRPLEFPLPPGEKPEGFESSIPYLLVHPFSRGENKSLPDECLARLIQELTPTPIVLVGNAPPGCQPPANCINLLNKTSLSGLIWLIRHAHFTLSVDSGPMHIAAAITDRLLGIHNWSNPLLVGPYNPAAWVWKNGSLLQTRDLTPENVASSQNFGLEHIQPVVQFLKGKF
jgi:ADP-heptose:LPS heptosyltransferase